MRYNLLENEDIESVKRRRFWYIAPFVVYTIASFQAELLFLIISIIFFSGFKDIITRFIWTMVLCTLGMGSVMGSLTTFFIIDKYEGKEAIVFTTILNFIVFGSCNLLCMKLDHIFDYWGSIQHPWYFNIRYPLILVVGYLHGKLLFGEGGRKELSKIERKLERYGFL
ncbi:hypothetical protein CU097_003912 [Rhizopus azygosporus]|uniref:Uncharacterized protein n=2 Tax=Rhizopus TaxID=4842 RepID=A0A367J2F0_RHIAZ|nr:hypothetical protein BCV71DRAFT_224940 [Rhizopus microsporus]RCH84090.1 hypothetical protein CU097_003912 [Rhizopus azygosporus]CEI95366.1 hypothetical protein RMCBS344292_09555 [Rhizopus microsporus]